MNNRANRENKADKKQDIPARINQRKDISAISAVIAFPALSADRFGRSFIFWFKVGK